MWHTAIYSAAIASASANQQVANVADNVLATSGSGFIVPPVINKLFRAAGIGNILNKAQLNSASLRDFTPFDIDPVTVGTVVSSPPALVDFADNPIPLVTNEELDAFVTNSAATSTQTNVVIWLADGPRRPVSGRMFSVRWTATATLTANGWTPVTITLDNGIPSGTFALVGARVTSAGALAFRFIPRGGQPYKPGGLATQTKAALDYRWQRYGLDGEWMRFTNTTAPQCEIFSGTADTAEEGILDLIQVGS